MSDFNRTYLVGNFAADPELKDIGNSNKVVNFTVATNRSWKGSQGEEAKEVSFIDCVAYGNRAEAITKYFKKGRKILIEGRLKQEKWTDKETQKMQSRIRVVVESFHFMDKKETTEASAATASASDISSATSGCGSSCGSGCVPSSCGGDDMPIVDATGDFDIL